MAQAFWMPVWPRHCAFDRRQRQWNAPCLRELRLSASQTTLQDLFNFGKSRARSCGAPRTDTAIAPFRGASQAASFRSSSLGWVQDLPSHPDRLVVGFSTRRFGQGILLDLVRLRFDSHRSLLRAPVNREATRRFLKSVPWPPGNPHAAGRAPFKAFSRISAWICCPHNRLSAASRNVSKPRCRNRTSSRATHRPCEL